MNARLEAIQAADPDSSSGVSGDFIRKASYYIMAEKLVEDRYLDYEKYIRAIDPAASGGRSDPSGRKQNL